MQAANEEKADLQRVVSSAGRQLQRAKAKNADLVASMEDKIANQTARQLETVYTPLLATYQSRCTWLEEELRKAKAAGYQGATQGAGPSRPQAAPSTVQLPQQSTDVAQVKP